MVSIQTGASVAKRLFPLVGPQGTTALRLIFGTVILLVVLRPWRTRRRPGSWKPLAGYGISLGLMNLLFYMALESMPLGIAVALEFTGPLAVAMIASRRPLDFVWIALAVSGLLLLLPVWGGMTGVDARGAALALGAGICWALYIVFGQRAGTGHATQTVALGSVIAACVAAPVGVAHAGGALLSPAILPLALAVAVLSSALPYSLEMLALTRLPAKTFGTLMSMEPAVATVSGMIFLKEWLAPSEWLAIALIIAASVGTTVTTAPPSAPVPD